MFSDPRMESDTSTEENSVGENLGYFYEMPLSEVFQPYDFEPIPSSPENDDFQIVCLHREVLKTVLHMLNIMRGDENIQNKSLRHVGYRNYTLWVHNRLGRGIRKVMPSCAIWAIRNAHPENRNPSYARES